jgi:hypothetical protein
MVLPPVLVSAKPIILDFEDHAYLIQFLKCKHSESVLYYQYARQLWRKNLYINRVNTAQRDNLAKNLLK